MSLRSTDSQGCLEIRLVTITSSRIKTWRYSCHKMTGTKFKLNQNTRHYAFNYRMISDDLKMDCKQIILKKMMEGNLNN